LEDLEKLYSTKMNKLEERLDLFEQDRKLYTPTKMGNFLMSAFTQKKFEEPLRGVKIVHVASEKGFSEEDIVLIELESTSESIQNKCDRFIEFFEQIISNMKLVPDKSCILLSSQQHKMIEQGGKMTHLKEKRTPIKMKLRDKVSKAKGQQLLTRYYKSSKASTSNSTVPYKKEFEPKTVKSLIEGITQKRRRDEVKIIWMPKKHYELDPSQYISVFLLNDVASKKYSNDLKQQCIDTLDHFPRGMWEKAVGWVNDCEKAYMDVEESENEENQSVEADDDSTNETRNESARAIS